MNRTNQFLQLDFLQIFRLGKNMGVFKRKRKMPIEYPECDYKLGVTSILKLCKEIINFKLGEQYLYKSNLRYGQIYFYLNSFSKNRIITSGNEITTLLSMCNFLETLTPEDKSFFTIFSNHSREASLFLRRYDYFSFIVPTTRIYKNTHYTTGYFNLLNTLEKINSMLFIFDNYNKFIALKNHYTNVLFVGAAEKQDIIFTSEVAAPIPSSNIISPQDNFNNALSRWRASQETA